MKTRQTSTRLPDDPGEYLLPSALNLAVAMTGSAERSGQRCQRWEDVWACDREIAEPMANFAVAVSPMSQETAQEAIDRLKTFYAETGSRWILWSAWPTPDPAPFGFQSVGKPPLMIRPAGVVETVLPAELHIEEVVDEAGMVMFERTFIQGYGLTSIQSLTSGSLFPGRSIRGPLRCWVGFRRGEPVTVAAACAYAGVVGVYCVATLPHARGRGYGAAITAVAAGIDPTSPVVLQASDSGYPVYRQLGFTVVARYDLWMG